MVFVRKSVFLMGIIMLVLIFRCGKKKPTEPSPPVTTGTLNGTVMNAADSTAIEAAQVITDPGDYITYTNGAGYYMLDGLPPGQYLIRASKDGFQNDTTAVSVEAGQTSTANLYLTPPVDFTLWEFATDKPVYYSTPAVADDGTLIVGTGIYMGTTSGSIYAVHPDGTFKWKYDLDNNAGTAVIGDDGTIYMMDRKNVLHALNPDGTLKWRYDNWENDDFAEVGQRPVAIGQDNTLYVYVGFDLYAIHPDGTRKWVFDPQVSGTPCGASAVVGQDNTIYAILGGEILYAINPDGTLKWELYLETYDEHSYTSPALDSDDVIYFGTENGDGGYVYAVYPTGIVKWRIAVGGVRPVRASPSIAADGTVYAATKAYSHRRPAEVLAISPDGVINWRFTVESIHFTPDDVYSTPTVGTDGLIYFGAETGFVYALNPDGTLNWKQDLHCGINWSSPTLIEDGTLYIGGMTNEGGVLIALQTGSPGLADSAWPTFRRNNKNTGRSGGD